MKRLMLGVTSAIAGYLVTKGLLKKRSDFEWISADNDGEVEEYVEPVFSVGESVLTVDPYTGDYVDTDFDMTPLYFEIEDVVWSEDEELFRYKLKDNPDWIAEVWLSAPEHPMMYKDLEENDETESKGEIKVKKQPKGHRALERTELARRQEWGERADVLLDRYNEFVRKGDTEGADRTMKKYIREQALFNAGSVIREVGGELGGERPEPIYKPTTEEDGA